MIDYPDQAQDRIAVPGVPDDIAWLGGQMQDTAHWVKKTYDALRRQESPNPTIINLDPDGAAGRIYRTSTRMRLQWIIFSGGTTVEVFQLTAGRGSIIEWIVPVSPAPVVIPFPVVFEPGIDYQVSSLTTPSAVNWRCRVVAYTELEEGGE